MLRFCLVFLFLFLPVFAQIPTPLPIYSGTPPGSLGNASGDSVYVWPYPASAGTRNGGAIVVFPGGGYSSLALDKEGHAPARWFNQRGFSTFVLKYRLGSAGYRHPVEMQDGQRAVRWVRHNAARYGINPAKVGVLGFSAGGHLASTVGTHFDSGVPGSTDSVARQSCRPDFQLLLYPVITMDSSFTHLGSRQQLLGTNPSPSLVALLSNEKQVTAQTPPAFLVHGLNDAVVPFRNSRVFYDSCVAHGVAVKVDSFANGPHGFGLADGLSGSPNLPLVAVWPADAINWLQSRGFPTTDIAIRERKQTAAVQERPWSWQIFFAGIRRNLLGRH